MKIHIIVILTFIGFFCHSTFGQISTNEIRIEALLDSAANNYEEAQFLLGEMYAQGNGVTKNESKAEYWYLKAAENNHEEAQYKLGMIYLHSKFKYNSQKGIDWLTKSAKRGYVEAQCELGFFYLNCNPIEYAKAYYWLHEASKQYNASASFALASILDNEEIQNPTSNDDREGYYYWLRDAWKSYRIGNPSNYQLNDANIYECKNTFALLYFNGTYVTKNKYKAYYWANDQLRRKLGIKNINIEEYEKKHPSVNLSDLSDLQLKPTALHEELLTKARLSEFDPKNPPILDIAEGSIQFADANNSNAVNAGEQSIIKLDIVNTGKGIARGCIAKTTVTGMNGITCSNVHLQDIPVGETLSIQIPIKANKEVTDGIATFTIAVEEPHGFGCNPVEMEVKTYGYRTPLVKLADYAISSSNGTNLKKRTPFDLQIMIQNIERGVADNVTVELSLPNNVMLIEGEAKNCIRKMQGGESKIYNYSLIVNNNYTSETLPIHIKIHEESGKYSEDGTISLHLNQNITQNKITITSNEQPLNSTPTIAKIKGGVKQSDVDSNIPRASTESPNTFAVVIANENYKREVAVPFALRDGEKFAEYCHLTLGIPSSNIHFLKDGTKNDILEELNWIIDVGKQFEDEAKLIIYYVGHGIPDEATGSPYLLPVDGRGNSSHSGILLDKVYSLLSELKSKSITVILDACFSGAKRDGEMLVAARGVALNTTAPRTMGNLIVLSAAQGDETAYPLQEEGHGMFTYYLLKRLQETSGEATLQDLSEYITREVSRRSIVVNSKKQTPAIYVSPIIINNWENWKLHK